MLLVYYRFQINHGEDMNNYQLFKSEDKVEAVNMDKFTASDDVSELLARHYVSVGFVHAASSEEAISNIGEVSSETLVVEKSKPDGQNVLEYESKYKTAQLVSTIVSGFGWVIFVVGIFAILAALGAGNTRYGFIMSQFIAAAIPGFSALVAGLFLVAAGQVMKATVDNADHTYQILHSMKNN